ncbi:hypothetical protein HGRIS_005271 [Hohenbuehelia grisea]|uniref:Peregrin n=1 Tax=Hohenbuehelia grisea TaxID=104357 RepID=A0ABR3JER1_9AGAR
MPRVRSSSATAHNHDVLPKVSFQRVEDEDFSGPPGVADQQARSYGYCDFNDFVRPQHYIRYIEPLENELATQVEYDMDEQDQEWLGAVNLERKKEQLGTVSYEVFEIIMDRLEKEWFDLTKNIPKPDFAMPSEDSTCAICDDSEGENSNAIVFCDGCNLAVHQDCYGVPYIPEGQWLCRKCTVSPENPVSCTLCPNEGGAFKQTVHGDWVHLLCAIWVPETRVANEVFMEPVTGVERISKQRWKLRCSICDIREGACIQCAKTTCFVAFHATCARKEKLLLPMKSSAGAEPMTLTSYCERHLPKEHQDARTTALATQHEEDDSDNPAGQERLSKSARAYAKTYKPGPPLVPAIIVDRIMQYINKVSVRKKQDFVLLVCRYWSLKREARRGAPLLKRLHLEPWTANASLKPQSEKEKMLKLEYLRRLRQDLESVYELTSRAHDRELQKLAGMQTISNVITEFVLPHEAPLRLAFENIVSLDRHEYFKNPVSSNVVPDYFDVVKKPMCWNFIDTKLERHDYWDVQAFKDDINLVLYNAVLYNKPGTPIYKTATRMQGTTKPFLDELDKLIVHRAPDDLAIHDVDQMDMSNRLTPPVETALGNLEPALQNLELLISSDVIADDLDTILDTDPLSSIFSYELAVPKPPPPPPPPKPRRPPKSAKMKRDRAGEYARRREQRRQAAEAEAAAPMIESEVLSSGARAPRTRGERAKLAAFEAEARGEVPLDDDGEEGTILDASDPVEPSTVDAEGEPDEPVEGPVADGESFDPAEPPPAAGPDQSEPMAIDAETVERAPIDVDMPPETMSPEVHPPHVDEVDVPPQELTSPMDMEQDHLEPPRPDESEQPEPTSVVTEEPEPPSVPTAEQSELTSVIEPEQPDPALAIEADQVDAVQEAQSEPLDASTSEPEPTSEPFSEPEPEPEPPAASSSRRKPRRSAQSPVELPPVVDDVDNQGLFKMFEHGWILPPEARRRGRPPANRQPLPPKPQKPPKKRSKTNESSRLSVHSTTASDNQTLQQGQDGASASTDPNPTGAPPKREVFAVDDNVSLLPFKVITEGDTQVVEMLDTPATRSARNKQQKAKQKARKSEGGAPGDPLEGVPMVGDPQTEPGPSRLVAEPVSDDGTSSLSELSEDETKAPKQAPLPPPPPPPRVTEKKAWPPAGTATVLPGTAPGSIVWAKTETYPWWPGTLHERFSAMIPPKVVRDQPYAQSRFPNELLHAVQFFDKTKSWAWLPAEKLRLLGVDNAVDQELLTRQKWKTASVKSQCRVAFRDATAAKRALEEPAAEEAAAGEGSLTAPAEPAAPEGEDADKSPV